MRVAIIGTKSPSAKQRRLATDYAADLAELGIEISTGAANGIDFAAMVGVACSNVSKLHVFVPWPSFNKHLIPEGANVTVFKRSIHQVWIDSVNEHHPNPGVLSTPVFKLHARNYGIVAHPEPVSAVIAFPKSMYDLGGTGQGMRVAKALGIRVFNMLEPLAEHDVEVFIQSIGV